MWHFALGVGQPSPGLFSYQPFTGAPCPTLAAELWQETKDRGVFAMFTRHFPSIKGLNAVTALAVQVESQRLEVEARHCVAMAFFPDLRGNPPSPHNFISPKAPVELFETAVVRVVSSSSFSRRPEAHPGIRISLSAAPSRVALDMALSRCAEIVQAHQGR